MSSKALIVWGGWDGHEPAKVAEVFRRCLVDDGFAADVYDWLDPFTDAEKMAGYDLIVPIWTMAKISDVQLEGVCKAVREGAGLAGCHGGMCDSFREAVDWQFMTGGQWVAHPGNDGVRYKVNIKNHVHPITAGIADFEVLSEQYYMHTDPANRVLATTRFPTADGPHVSNGPVEMPVIWTKMYGLGKVFYSSIGHVAATVEAEPHLTIMRRGFRWAARTAAGNKQ